MSKESRQAETVRIFKEYLLGRDYSASVISHYVRNVKGFLSSGNLPLAMSKDSVSLKENIKSYLKIPSIKEKKAISASLHTFYHSIMGYSFFSSQKSYTKVTKPIEVEIEKFKNYLFTIRRLGSNTINDSYNTVKIFLYSTFPDNKKYSFRYLKFQHIQRYLSETIGHVCPASKKTIITRIRSFFRYLEFQYGVKRPEILDLPLIAPVRKLSSIPRYLSNDEIDRLLNASSRETSIGTRDYAIVRCFTDLALRCSEVANLILDDLNWKDGTLTIRHTKSHSERTLPLSRVTGKAIESYLVHSRPRTEERIIFVRFKREKGQAMGVSQVRGVVRRAADRAGLEAFKGTHMLRHKVAKDMIINGTDIKTIADILGHESIETTLIYTKVNFSELLEVAGNWPGAHDE
jgi:site-specific recombinase XerD